MPRFQWPRKNPIVVKVCRMCETEAEHYTTFDKKKGKHKPQWGCISCVKLTQKTKPRSWLAWRSMKSRAGKMKYYENVAVCERWKSYLAFVADMGEPPEAGMSLDRIDNSKGYEPGNCRWATVFLQNQNRRNVQPLALGKRTMSIAEWSRETGIKTQTIRMRLSHGWSVEDALTRPVQPRGSP